MFKLFKTKWDKITLHQFQQIEGINSRADLGEMDKLLFTTCIVFGLTEFELDNMKVRKATKLIEKVSSVFASEFKQTVCKKLGGYEIEYDPSRLNFGQYIDLAFFLQNPLPNAHRALASIVSTDAAAHRERAEYFLSLPVRGALGTLGEFSTRLAAFNKEYGSLFGVDEEVHGHGASTDLFIKRFGWIYSAEKVAEYERISLEAAYALPVRRALNALVYLKARIKYESEQLKIK